MGICETRKNNGNCKENDLKNNNVVTDGVRNKNCNNDKVELINTIIYTKENAETYQIQVYGEGDNNLSKFVSLDYVNKVKTSVCKIRCDNKSGTGFFMNVPFNGETFRYLITNNHVINEDLLNKNINLEIHNRNDIKLLLDNKNRDIHFLPGKDSDIAAIEIIEEDFEINRNINFFNYDKNYLNGYDVYINKNVFALGYPGELNISIGTGKITEQEGYQFSHNIPTAGGSSGSPIINSETTEIIGIHKGGTLLDDNSEKNFGTFIGKIVDTIQNSFKNSKKLLKKEKKNLIWAEIDINEKNIYQKIPIINSSHEEIRRNKTPEYFEIYSQLEEEEMKNCEIEIEKTKIPFSYNHEFTKLGKHTIRYSFKKYLTNLNNMFKDCSCISYLDLSNFNTKNVTDMSHMFFGCSSLSEIKLDNLNTEKVIDMTRMFCGCKNLISLDLSSFNTKKVTKMNSMFYDCRSLKNINISSFNTENVTDMFGMFYRCSALSSLDLSFFNTINVTDMHWMFTGCESLTNLNVSSFNTKNVTEMDTMFSECSKLKNLDLSNFNTENVKNMSFMFAKCSSLLYLDLSNFDTKNVTKFGMNFWDEHFINFTSFILKGNLSNMFFGCSPNLFQNIKTKDKKLLETIKNMHYDI